MHWQRQLFIYYIIQVCTRIQYSSDYLTRTPSRSRSLYHFLCRNAIRPIPIQTSTLYILQMPVEWIGTIVHGKVCGHRTTRMGHWHNLKFRLNLNFKLNSGCPPAQRRMPPNHDHVVCNLSLSVPQVIIETHNHLPLRIEICNTQVKKVCRSFRFLILAFSSFSESSTQPLLPGRVLVQIKLETELR